MKTVKLEWESIDDYHHRAKVFGGWLVKAMESATHFPADGSQPLEHMDWRMSMTFMSDPEHKWGDVDHSCLYCHQPKKHCYCGFGVKPYEGGDGVAEDEPCKQHVYLSVDGGINMVCKKCNHKRPAVLKPDAPIDDSPDYIDCENVQCPYVNTRNIKADFAPDECCPFCKWKPKKWCECEQPICERDMERMRGMCLLCGLEVFDEDSVPF